jgi:hypothetical protein
VNQTPTVKADSISAVRPGLLGLGVPGVPSNMGPYGALIEMADEAVREEYSERGYMPRRSFLCECCGALATVDCQERGWLCEGCSTEEGAAL